MKDLEDIRKAFDLIQLSELVAASSGRPALRIGIIDGPVDLDHPAFSDANITTVKPAQVAGCKDSTSGECGHGTSIAGVLCARRDVPAPAIAPACTYLLYPIFPEQCRDPNVCGQAPQVTPRDLARAIIETVDAGARIINLSLGIITSEVSARREVEEACEYACQRKVLLVTASGNQGRMGFLPLLQHAWILPVAACSSDGGLMPESNVGPTIGSRGLRAPGMNIPTTAPGSRYARMSGTSIAAAFATGALALLWSAFPDASASQIKQFVLESAAGRAQRSIVPPLLNVYAAAKLCLPISSNLNPTFKRRLS